MPRPKQDETVVISSRISPKHRRLLRMWAATNGKQIGDSMEQAIEALISAQPIELTH